MGQFNKTNFEEYSQPKTVDTIDCQVVATDDGFVFTYTKEQMLDVARSLNLEHGDTVTITIKKKEA